MTRAVRQPEVTFEEYLALEDASELRHEWAGGHAYTMAGGTERHDLLTGLFYRALADAAEARGCRAFQQNRRVRVGRRAYYPDVLVVCPGGPSPDRQFERDLTVVVEVLSPSTERVDRVEKALAYPTAPGFAAYLVADPERRRVEVCRAGPAGPTWSRYESGQLDLDVLAVALDLDRLYDTLDRTSIT